MQHDTNRLAKSKNGAFSPLRILHDLASLLPVFRKKLNHQNFMTYARMNRVNMEIKNTVIYFTSPNKKKPIRIDFFYSEKQTPYYSRASDTSINFKQDPYS